MQPFVGVCDPFGLCGRPRGIKDGDHLAELHGRRLYRSGGDSQQILESTGVTAAGVVGSMRVKKQTVEALETAIDSTMALA